LIIKTSNHIWPWFTEHKKTKKYDVGNADPGLGQAHTYHSEVTID
jgi:hypothetical protein